MDKCPSKKDLQKARNSFLKNEPRDLFYRVATELIELTIKRKTKISLSEALAILLQTWNIAYYRFRSFNEEHFNKIDYLIEKYASEIITEFRPRSILSIREKDKKKICEIFNAFEKVLGPVGTAKSLHLLAPHFFPLWDRKIAKEYGSPLCPKGANADKYYNFMRIARKQYKKLKALLPKESNLLKSIDEYNYCHYTKHWI